MLIHSIDKYFLLLCWLLDHDECSSDNHDCSQICNNHVGGHTCSCFLGCTLDPDGTTCAGKIIIMLIFDQPLVFQPSYSRSKFFLGQDEHKWCLLFHHFLTYWLNSACIYGSKHIYLYLHSYLRAFLWQYCSSDFQSCSP